MQVLIITFFVEYSIFSDHLVIAVEYTNALHPSSVVDVSSLFSVRESPGFGRSTWFLKVSLYARIHAAFFPTIIIICTRKAVRSIIFIMWEKFLNRVQQGSKVTMESEDVDVAESWEDADTKVSKGHIFYMHDIIITL